MLIENPTPTESKTLIPALLVQGSPADQQKIDFLLSASPHQLVPWPGNPDATAHDFLGGLLVARPATNKLPIAAVWAHPAPGATALLGKPVSLIHGTHGFEMDLKPPSMEIQSQLIAKALKWSTLEWSGSSTCELLQAVAEPNDHDFSSALQQNGLQKLVDLVYLSSPLLPISPPAADNQRSDVSGRPFCQENDHGVFSVVPPQIENLERWYRLLAATYVESRDCPAINGRRSLTNTVAGYIASGTYWERGWVIGRDLAPPSFDKSPKHSRNAVEVNPIGTDFGGMILADHPTNDFMELIYFGISPLARGKGWGIRILQEAARLAQQNGRSRIITAVDRQNLPALRVYAAANYTALEERTVFARFFTVSNPGFDDTPRIR
ncbi:MAG: GNAT family N-acetyltransferase [Planctomycetaceae bacterium]|nr:GNAT family N-acetyltransferase [Planctomycetaceae bacterium]